MGETNGSETLGTKTGAAAQTGNQAKKPHTAAKSREPPPGMRKRTNPGMGNCVFWACARAMDRRGGHRALRVETVQHLLDNTAEYKDFWDGRSPDVDETVMVPEDTRATLAQGKAYCEKLAVVGACGGALEAAAMANILKRQIIILAPSGTPESYDRRAPGTPIVLWYENKHYELLEGALPEQVAKQATAGGYAGRRGSGRTTDTEARDDFDVLEETLCAAVKGRKRSQIVAPVRNRGSPPNQAAYSLWRNAN